MQEAEDAPEAQATVGSSSLPIIASTTPDVASAFKRFLRDIPGGILGSLGLFEELREIESVSVSSSSTGQNGKCIKSRLVALALLSLKSDLRFSLICAVFGLLAYSKHDEAEGPSSNTDCAMTASALSVVFAPLLLGDLTDFIGDGQGPSALLPCVNSGKRNILGLRKSSKRERSHSMKLGIERITAATAVINLLIQEWPFILRYIQNYTSLLTSTASTVQPRHQSGSQLQSSNEQRDMSRHAAASAGRPLSGPFDPSNMGLQMHRHNLTVDSSRLSYTSRTVSLPQLPPTKEESMEDAVDLPINKVAAQACSSRSNYEHLLDAEGLAWWEKTPRSTVPDAVHGQDLPSTSILSGPISTLDTSTPSSCSTDLYQARDDPPIPSPNLTIEKPGDLDASPETAASDGTTSLPLAVEGREGAVVMKMRTNASTPKTPVIGKINAPSLIPRPRIDIRRTRCSTLSPPKTSIRSHSHISHHPHSEPKRPNSSPHALDPVRKIEYTPLRTPPKMMRTLKEPKHLASIEEPPIAHRLIYRNSSERLQQRDRSLPREELVNARKPNVGILYAEINRLKDQLAAGIEENMQLRQELYATRSLRVAGTLSEKLRAAERDAKMWKHRAEWAETTLFGKGRDKPPDPRM